MQRYHDGELSAAERAAYESHLASCTACRELDAQFAAVFGALGDLPLAEPSAGFDESVMARVDVARYRRSMAKRAVAWLRRGWDLLPAPVRVSAQIAAVFAIFTAVYTPILGMIASGARWVVTVAGSGIYVLRRVLEDPSIIGQFLEKSANYRLAVKILAETFERQISGISVSHLVLGVLAAAVVLFFAARVTRTAWNKGETHVGIL
jgi:predicted anti-sigma-YlaC factor YlaD